MFISKTFLLAALAALKHTVHAAPASEVDNLVVIDTQDSPFGPLVIYGFANATTVATEDTSAAALNERACGSNDVTCDGGNVPNAPACANLIASLSANSGTGLGVSPRSICQTTNGNTCCVSWHNPAPGLVESMLIAGANAAYNGCVVHGLSGLTQNTVLNGVCTKQCLRVPA
ncbi:hypothetical protein EXIGLDRAFT_722714 [Exidia glandulosa HHB12029]|uniref:WD-like domain-containing protein n=1 Tax=Exidia glandulosa HHB12029 TaxID=1314781 RepID=A0A165N363_EXIGL|nr:hypothetical protein EXIGLDRAFT_722714 [Exidia glandulosa HHB12029]